MKIKKITSIDISDVQKVTMVYDGRIELDIGNTGSVERKLALAAKVIEREDEIDPTQFGIIDLGSVEGKAFFRPMENPEKSETEGETGEVAEGETQPDGEIQPEDEAQPEETTQAQTQASDQ